METMGDRSRISVHVLSAMLFFSATVRPVFAQSALTAAGPPDAAIVSAQQEPGAAVPGELGFRFQGYLRSGFGVDSDGKGQQPFQAPLAGAKYRLGNEAETYLETTFLYGANSEGENPGYFDVRRFRSAKRTRWRGGFGSPSRRPPSGRVLASTTGRTCT
jgi:hypothetical protein